MPYLTMHLLPGDAAELAARKRAHVDPVIATLAPQHGAQWSVTAATPEGLLVINLWQSATGAAAFTREPAVQQAVGASGLPAPLDFRRYEDADVQHYAGPGAPPPAA